MNMKKLIAGVVAAALTATSLAVVNVSAEAVTETQDYTAKSNKLTFSVEHTITAKSGVNLNDVLPTTTSNTYQFQFGLDRLGGEITFYPWGSTDQPFTLSKDGFKASGAAKITVVGILKGEQKKNTDGTPVVDEAGNPVYETTNVQSTASTTTKSLDTGWEEFYSLGSDSKKQFMDAHELDVGKFSQITEIKISQNFELPAVAVHYLYWGKYYVSVDESKVEFYMSGDIKRTTDNGTAAEVASDRYKEIFYVADRETGAITGTKKTIKITNCKNNISDILGARVNFDQIYTLDGDTSMTGDGGDEFQKLLRWVNDLIGEKKGAEITFKFAPATQASSGLNVLGWGAGDNRDPWRVDASSSAAKQDIAFAVNARSTALLRQSVNLDGNLVATFNWDELVAASEYTIAGNVSSLSFKLYSDGDNASKILRTDDDGEFALLSSITVKVPDQGASATGNDAARIIQAGSDDTFVKVIGTEKTIYGNGAVELKVANNITANSVSYDVKLLDANGAYVQPAGEITLQLSIPTDFQGRKLSSTTVKHTLTDGTVETLNIENADTYVTDKYVTVKTSKFSAFELGFEEEETTTEAPETTTEAPVETTTEAPAETTAAPAQAGDKNANTGVAIAIVPAVIAAAGVIISKKRK